MSDLVTDEDVAIAVRAYAKNSTAGFGTSGDGIRAALLAVAPRIAGRVIDECAVFIQETSPVSGKGDAAELRRVVSKRLGIV